MAKLYFCQEHTDDSVTVYSPDICITDLVIDDRCTVKFHKGILGKAPARLRTRILREKAMFALERCLYTGKPYDSDDVYSNGISAEIGLEVKPEWLSSEINIGAVAFESGSMIIYMTWNTLGKHGAGTHEIAWSVSSFEKVDPIINRMIESVLEALP